MMKKPSTGRRAFLKKIAVGGMSAAVLPVIPSSAGGEDTSVKTSKSTSRIEKEKRKYNDIYQGDFLKRIAFPIGGMGAGMFCLEGTGAISHMSVRNKPSVFFEPGVFGAISVKDLKGGAKIVE